MAEILAHITQVFNQSPQVSSLVGAHEAALEEVKRSAQFDQIREYGDRLKKTVLAAEKAAQVGAADSEEKKREAGRRGQKKRPAAAGRDKRDAARRARPARPEKPVLGPDDRPSVIDVCV
jgi:hypothetical protein